MAEAFSEWIFHSAHFVLILLPLAEGWQRAMAALDRHHQRSRTEYPDCPVPRMVSTELDSMPLLVGSAPPSAAWIGQIKEGGGHTLQSMMQGIHCHPPLIEVAWIPMGTPWLVRLRAPINTGESNGEKSIWHLCIWICQFSSRLTQMRMSCTLCGGLMYRAG